jgi:hypothetical protein
LFSDNKRPEASRCNDVSGLFCLFTDLSFVFISVLLGNDSFGTRLASSFFTVVCGTWTGSIPVWHPNAKKEKAKRTIIFPKTDLSN